MVSFRSVFSNSGVSNVFDQNTKNTPTSTQALIWHARGRGATSSPILLAGGSCMHASEQTWVEPGLYSPGSFPMICCQVQVVPPPPQIQSPVLLFAVCLPPTAAAQSTGRMWQAAQRLQKAAPSSTALALAPWGRRLHKHLQAHG